MKYTDEQLTGMAAGTLHSLYERARKSGGGAGQAIVAQIERLGLLHRGGMSETHPIYLEMHAIVWSSEGQAAALDMASRGLPAVAGIDPLLQGAMGSRYQASPQFEKNAGYLVAGLMRHLGWAESGRGRCPPGTLVKSGLTWRPRGKNE